MERTIGIDGEALVGTSLNVSYPFRSPDTVMNVESM